MKILMNLVFLLSPLQPLQAALVFEPESCCAPDHAEALNQAGSRYYAAGDYGKAEHKLREALALEQEAAHPNPASLAGILANLAAAVRMQSRLPEAAELYARAIALRESTSGPESPELARPLAGQAMVYASQDQLALAIRIAERAVRVSGNGTENVRSSAIANNALATLLLSRGDSARAGALEQRMVDELKRTGNTETEEYVNATTNLGTSLFRRSNYPQAEVAFRSAEAAGLKLAGPEHPVLAVVWNNLGKVREGQGDWKNAETLFAQSIAVWRKALGPQHPDVAYGLTNLASLNQARKRYAEAGRLYRQALEIDRTALGADSLRVANDWNNLGALSVVTHHSGEAERLLTKALSIAEARAGWEHPDTAGIAVNLAVVYFSQRRFEEAATLFGKALPVKERVLGRDSTELASILRLYASSQKASQNYVAAERAELQATRIRTHNALMAEAR